MKERKESNGLEWVEWYCSERKAKQIELTGKGILTDHATGLLKAEFLNDSHYEILLS